MAPHANDPDGNAHGISIHETPMRLQSGLQVQSPNVMYTDDSITSKYIYRTTEVEVSDGIWEREGE